MNAQLFNQFNKYLFYFKSAGVLLTVLFLAVAAYFAIKSGWLFTYINRTREVARNTPNAKKRVLKAWKTVVDYLQEDNAHAWKLAVIQSDILLDEALRAAGAPGKNIGERLKTINQSILPNLNDVWNAHRLRNRIAHETEFMIDRQTATETTKIYEEAFRHLGLID